MKVKFWTSPVHVHEYAEIRRLRTNINRKRGVAPAARGVPSPLGISTKGNTMRKPEFTTKNGAPCWFKEWGKDGVAEWSSVLPQVDYGRICKADYDSHTGVFAYILHHDPACVRIAKAARKAEQ